MRGQDRDSNYSTSSLYKENPSESNNNNSNKNNTFSAPSINLPKGGGAIKGIGEKFSINPATGTGSLSIPIFTSLGRSGFGPQLSLLYDSGAGNGPFGLGWNLGLPSITRKTEKGLPQYKDTDTFILSGAEDLVPVFEKDDAGDWVIEDGKHVIYEKQHEADGVTYIVHRYRPRIEGLFAHIERWMNKDDPQDSHWRSITKDNVTSFYGETPQARIFHPQSHHKIFSWLLERTEDNKGNVIHYSYKKEDREFGNAEDLPSVSPGSLAEKNRENAVNLYIKSIEYGNKKYSTNKPFNSDELNPKDWHFQVIFDYGEHEGIRPTPKSKRDWLLRKDPFSSFRSGFEIRTRRLCRRVLMFHHFPQDLGNDQVLVRSTDFTYDENKIATKLISVTQTGYPVDKRFKPRQLPPLEFEYSEPLISEEIKSIDDESLENLPRGIDGSIYRLLDLDGEGLPGILTEQNDELYYRENRGGAQFTSMRTVRTRPTMVAAADGAYQLNDLDGNGRLSLVSYDESLPGYWERTEDYDWDEYSPFKKLPNIDWQDPNLQWIDLNGDGFSDILIAKNDCFKWYPSKAKEGFEEARIFPKPKDEEKGPALVFADGTQSIYLADMSGDGLSDIVRIRNGSVCYWPHTGYGSFGAKQVMENAPHFDRPDRFQASRVRLTDIDGSGTTDIIYLCDHETKIYFNQAGNRFSEPQALSDFPDVDNITSVQTADLLGKGTACLIWSSPLPGENIRYIDLMSQGKPHLLTKVINNLGAETTITYEPSTYFYLKDKKEGKPWITRLPFPLQVVKRIEIEEKISKSHYVTQFAYHHGYFDGNDREFRGFGMVEQVDTDSQHQVIDGVEEKLMQAPVLTKTWFHTGAWIKGAKISRQFENEYYKEDPEAFLLDDTVLPDGLNPEETHEACRALKGRMLRQEIYSLDNSVKELHPYTITEQNFLVRREQPVGENPFAVFSTHSRETLNYHYERDPHDPRILHQMTLSVDEFGNVTESTSIAYSRRETAGREEEQEKLLITYSENTFAQKIEEFTVFRHSQPASQKRFELTGIEPPESELELLTIDDISRYIKNIKANHDILAFENKPNNHRPQLRLIQATETTYYDDSVDDPINELPVSEVGHHGLVYQTYELAFTPGLLSEVYGSRLNTNVLGQTGGYAFREDKWWKQSGRQVFKKELFYLAEQFIDPFRQNSTNPESEPDKNFQLSYDSYKILLNEIIDPVDNQTQAEYDYRVLQPKLITDPNGNRQAAAFDALGMVTGTAVMGKEGENLGDLLDGFKSNLSESDLQQYIDEPISNASLAIQKASTRITYDLWRYHNTKEDELPQPIMIWSLARTIHDSDKSNPGEKDFQHSFLHQDGLGREIQTKILAEPGDAPYKENGELARKDNGELKKRPTDPRWVGTGRTVYNNKGNPVKQYEPFFSSTHFYEPEKEMTEQGVTRILHYDPLGRVIRIDQPDKTFTKAEFTPWEQKAYDQNDTVLESEWYEEQGSPDPAGNEPDEPEERAAWLAARHADSPTTTKLDSLGRTFLTIEDNKEFGKYDTRSTYDIAGNVIRLTDAKKRPVMVSDFDMLDNALRNQNIDNGERFILMDVAGKPIMTWDANGNRIQTEYDVLRRPTHVYVDTLDENGNPAHTILAERLIYGETLDREASRKANLLGKLYLHFDGAGLLTNEAFDFKGNLKKSSRQVTKTYDTIPDWNTLANLQNPVEIKDNAQGLLESESFTLEMKYDALNRPTEKIQYQQIDHQNIIRIQYNEAGLLEMVEAKATREAAIKTYIANIDYNAKGQRDLIEYGNSVKTNYAYDEKTWRLTHLKSSRKNGGKKLQDISYTYDPVGNITEIYDKAHEEVIWNNQTILQRSRYRYDPLYRLRYAQGREHDGQNKMKAPNHSDFAFLNHPNDGQAWRSYTETYAYDETGNITMMHHGMSQNLQKGWTRWYYYDEQTNAELAVIDPEIMPGSNRLIATATSEDPAAAHLTYEHDANGNMITMPHLEEMKWDHIDQLIEVTLNHAVDNDNATQKAFYSYDSTGQRVRKVVKKSGLIEERIYAGDFEVFRRHRNGIRELERETLHIMDDRQRTAMIETESFANGNNNGRVRYQLNNHLQSSHLEVDGTSAARIISYEEYHPYGTTAYAATNGQVEVSAKRYRYSGKERDEETGFYYYGARYYAAWLGRWILPDPAGLVDGINLYEYVKGNPILFLDPTGNQLKLPEGASYEGEISGHHYYSVPGLPFVIRGPNPNLPSPNEEAETNKQKESQKETEAESVKPKKNEIPNSDKIRSEEISTAESKSSGKKETKTSSPAKKGKQTKQSSEKEKPLPNKPGHELSDAFGLPPEAAQTGVTFSDIERAISGPMMMGLDDLLSDPKTWGRVKELEATGKHPSDAMDQVSLEKLADKMGFPKKEVLESGMSFRTILDLLETAQLVGMEEKLKEKKIWKQIREAGGGTHGLKQVIKKPLIKKINMLKQR